jgi:riboflavin kinase/FMN adenylyltransferase
MRVFRSAGEVPADFGPAVVTIGNFDGVHLGHREILRRVVAIGRERGLTATVLTFDPHPARVLAPERAPKLIATVSQRLRRFEAEGIEAVLLLPFSREFAKAGPEEFARDVLARTVHARVVMVGDDFRFGYRQAGNIETLRSLGQEHGFELKPMPQILCKGTRVSSTAIRGLIAAGKVTTACRMMRAPFALEGPVVQGYGIGTKQTVPTLNLAAENELIPGDGVYVTRTRDEASGEHWKSITNVGKRPTFEGTERTVETFLLDPPPPSAPARIEVSFLAFMRGERKFGSPVLLREQILRDVGAANRFHRRIARLTVG